MCLHALGGDSFVANWMGQVAVMDEAFARAVVGGFLIVIFFLAFTKWRRASGKAVIEKNESDTQQTPPRRASNPVPPKGKRLNTPPQVELPPLTGIIRGTSRFDFHVVGESYYQAALRKIRNSTDMAHGNVHQAFIVTEPDNIHDGNACAVYIRGWKVGHLPRNSAAEFVRQMRHEYGVEGVMCLECRAKLTGGYRDKPHLGVMLNLPTD